MAGRMALAGLVALAGLCGGCLDRTLVITSEPAGATVSINDVELGRTPVEAEFTYYGTYDVLVTLEGYEPLRTRATATAPVYEYPPVDLFASALPARIDSRVKWHFQLEPSIEARQSPQEIEAGVTDRARALRGQLQRP